MTPAKHHYFFIGKDSAGATYTPEAEGDCTLLSIGELANEWHECGDCLNPMVFRFTGRACEDVTEQAAALVFEKWLEDADADALPGEWLTENCKAADDEHQRRRMLDPAARADEARDMGRAA